MTIEHEPVSPRIAELGKELRSGNAAALDAFWARLEDEGAPIIEPIHGDTERSLVTFVWRQTERAREAAVYGPGLAGLFDVLHQVDGTDLFYRTYSRGNDFRFSYRLALNPPSISLPVDSEENLKQLLAYLSDADLVIRDPLNHNAMQTGGFRDPRRPDEIPPQVFNSVVELPQAPSQSYLARRPGIPHGWVHGHSFRSAILGNERNIWVYTPPGYAESEADYGLVIAFDNSYVTMIPMHNILDNLLAEGRVPPLIAACVDSLDQPTRSRELVCHEPFSESLATEILPWLQANYRVTSNPARVVVAGSSLGGLAAGFVALRRPELYGNVLSQSGSFGWGPGSEPGKPRSEWHVDWQWLARQYMSAATLPLRFYLEAGLFETASVSPYVPRESDLLLANRRMHEVLVEKGYEVRYSEFDGGHDYACWRGSLADGLIALLGT